MSTRRWLPTVLRARQAAEDLAAQQVAAARRDAELAAGQLAAQQSRLAGMALPESATVVEFHAEVAGQQAALASLSAASNRVQFADARLAGHLSQLTEAARSRRTVEKMQERIETSLAAQALSLAQREQDDVTLARRVGRAAG
jgi:flagellar biosynthesis chaperone FliJ